jgi:hypothetical protein
VVDACISLFHYIIELVRDGVGLTFWCFTPFQQYFSYIVTVSFIVGESQPPAADY